MKLIEKLKKIFKKKEKVNEKDNIEDNNYNKLLRNSIKVMIDGKYNEQSLSYFGGLPLVPKDFEWPYYNSDSIDDTNKEIKLRPLAFLVQFDCEELAKLDSENLLPHKGILCFFYCVESYKFGFSPNDKGCAKVYYFENKNELEIAKAPKDLKEKYVFLKLNINLEKRNSYPDYENVPNEYDIEQYQSFYEALPERKDNNISKLLGWSDTIQNEMRQECELVTNGYYLGGTFEEIPEDVLKDATSQGKEKWLLLFQLDCVDYEDFELMLGDSGRLYFFIKKEDLAKKMFEDIWAIVQCY